jgi:hypothetical protein
MFSCCRFTLSIWAPFLVFCYMIFVFRFLELNNEIKALMGDHIQLLVSVSSPVSQPIETSRHRFTGSTEKNDGYGNSRTEGAYMK